MKRFLPLVTLLLVCTGLRTAVVLGQIGTESSTNRGSEPDESQSKDSTPQDSTAKRTAINEFLTLVTSPSQSVRRASLSRIDTSFADGDEVLLLEAARFARDRRSKNSIFSVLKSQTGQDFGRDYDEWFKWIWSRSNPAHPDYADFKSALYAKIDPRFAEYFSNRHDATIRLDEVRWGGVYRDGIPPLKDPQVLPAERASYLADSDVVFGVHFGGHARAYPKRILAWHEMVKDVVGGKSINGVYCTLCGSMIVYDTEIGGKHFELGTSGFLYRSNKLMYDHATSSMWSTLRGEPVIGPLVGKQLKLKPLYVVTTTWGKWKQQHPDTDVLSLNTGHRRDYSEGAAYRDYFATDELMFHVPKTDNRLKNKDEVLVIRAGDAFPVAIAAEFLRRNRVHHESIDDTQYVVLTDESGANRVYTSEDVRFVSWVDASTVRSSDGREWRVTEDALERTDSNTKLPRAAAHRAFWFGWHAGYPDTKLIK